jgi:hypothetical protein
VIALVGLAVGIGLAAQHWSLVPSISAYFRWELPPPDRLSGMVGAAFEMQMHIAGEFFSNYFRWEVLSNLMSALAHTVL